MNERSPEKLNIIKIVDPLLCVRCDNAYIADVVCEGDEIKKMFFCSRKDCDNWVCEGGFAQEESMNEAA